MTKRIEIYNSEDKILIKSSMEDTEFCNPVEYFFDSYLMLILNLKREIRVQGFVDILKDGNLSFEDGNEIIQKNRAKIKSTEKEIFDETFEKCIQEFEILRNTKIPENFIHLFSAKSKNEQKKLLLNQQIFPYQLLALYCVAYLEYGYTFSEYKSEHLPIDLKWKDFPDLFYEDKDEIHKIGETSLSDGQLKQSLKNRNVTVSRFLDKGEEFHCFFVTYKSLRGEEKNWKNGQPHFHYISDKFGLSRDKVLNELKSKKYKLNTLPHINVFNE